MRRFLLDRHWNAIEVISFSVIGIVAGFLIGVAR